MEIIVTIVGMVLNALTSTIAALLVYRTARDKLIHDLEHAALKHRLEALEAPEKKETPQV